MADRELLSALVERAKGYRDRVPVFRVEPPDPKPLMKEARTLARFAWPWFGECQPRFQDFVMNGVATMLVPEDGQVDVFYPSGAIAGVLRTATSKNPLADDEKEADRKALIARANTIAPTIANERVGKDDELRFESLWEKKAQGVTLRGERTAVALLEVVGAFRRYLHGLPVLGRASVHVGLGGNSEVTKWGIDWRRLESEPFIETPVVDPKDGAKRVMEDLSWRRPEKAFTLNDFEPASFTLGYLSLGRRSEQSVMQPAWVAVLRPLGDTTMGQVIAVSASAQLFEPIGGPMRMTRTRVRV